MATKSKHFTLIGSRTTPEHINQLLEDIAYELFRLGFVGNSGGCDLGPDHSMTKALIRFIADFGIEGGKVAEIYIPWKRAFNLKHGDLGGAVINAQYLDNYPEARAIAEKVHPAWEKMKDSHRDLHSRNPYQVLGFDLESPTGLVLTHCPVNKAGKWTGGTATALEIAHGWMIRIVNAFIPEEYKALEAMLETLRNAPGYYKRVTS